MTSSLASVLCGRSGVRRQPVLVAHRLFRSLARENGAVLLRGCSQSSSFGAGRSRRFLPRPLCMAWTKSPWAMPMNGRGVEVVAALGGERHFAVPGARVRRHVDLRIGCGPGGAAVGVDHARLAAAFRCATHLTPRHDHFDGVAARVQLVDQEPSGIAGQQPGEIGQRLDPEQLGLVFGAGAVVDDVVFFVALEVFKRACGDQDLALGEVPGFSEAVVPPGRPMSSFNLGLLRFRQVSLS